MVGYAGISSPEQSATTVLCATCLWLRRWGCMFDIDRYFFTPQDICPLCLKVFVYRILDLLPGGFWWNFHSDAARIAAHSAPQRC